MGVHRVECVFRHLFGDYAGIREATAHDVRLIIIKYFLLHIQKISEATDRGRRLELNFEI